MKHVAVLVWAVLGILGVAMPVAAATAPTTGRNMYELNMADPGASAACENRGGTVTPIGLNKVCILPPGCVADYSAMLMTTAIMDPVTTEAKKACTDACGMISSSTTGQTFCTKAAKQGGTRSMAPSVRPPREPTN